MPLIDKSLNAPTIISFNSKDRSSGTNSNFTNLPVDLGVHDYDSVCLMACSIPKSFYNVPTNQSIFILRELGVDTNIQIPIGNYNKINLATKLSLILTTASLNSWNYVVSYPPYTEPDDFKFTFTVSNNGLNQPSLLFDDDSPHRQLGFEVNSINTFIGDVLISTNAINLAFILRIFINSNVVKNSNDSVLEEIQSIGSFPFQSVVYYEQNNVDINTRDFNSDNLNSWNFILQDSFGKEIDLNGIPWSFTLCFYTRNITHELHKTDLQIQNEERLFNISQQKELIDKQISEPIADFPIRAPFSTVIPDFLQTDDYIT